jgi:hypothetical protein
MDYYKMKISIEREAIPPFDPKYPEKRWSDAVIKGFLSLGGEYEVTEDCNYKKNTWISVATIRKGVTSPVAGATWGNPHDILLLDTGKAIAFKRAVEEYIRVNLFSEYKPEHYGRFVKVAMYFFRLARHQVKFI